MKDPFEKGTIGDAMQLSIDLVDAPHCPRMHGRLEFAKRQRQTVECQVPRREPRVLPGVGYGQDMSRVEVPPAGVTPASAFDGWWRTGGVACQPLLDIPDMDLPTPQKPANT